MILCAFSSTPFVAEQDDTLHFYRSAQPLGYTGWSKNYIPLFLSKSVYYRRLTTIVWNNIEHGSEVRCFLLLSTQITLLERCRSLMFRSLKRCESFLAIGWFTVPHQFFGWVESPIQYQSYTAATKEHPKQHTACNLLILFKKYVSVEWESQTAKLK